MASVNVVVIVGNLTRDPELRALPSGMSVCDLGVAVNERFKNGATGQWEDRPNFFDVTVFGGQADACSKYLSKGRAVAVHGRLRWESWEKDGQKRSKVKIVADTVQFLGEGKGQASSGGGQQQAGYSEYKEEQPDVPMEMPAVPASSPADEDDIPF